MSSETGPRPRVRWLALALLIASATASLTGAAEATARGRNATLTWIDENGQRQEVAGKEIRYGYFTRVYLKIPKDGKNYRDEERQDKGLPFAEDFLRFSIMDKIELKREIDPDSGASRLALKITLVGDRVRTGRATTLAGATHPSSPYIQFEVEGVKRRIELMPLAPEDQRRGKPQLVALDFTL
ncbi:MAG TPA: hypothetical protein VGK94_09905 [Candidatus Polarisedimenticolia bacterium]|jgi:hypothetical protein